MSLASTIARTLGLLACVVLALAALGCATTAACTSGHDVIGSALAVLSLAVFIPSAVRGQRLRERSWKEAEEAIGRRTESA